MKKTIVVLGLIIGFSTLQGNELKQLLKESAQIEDAIQELHNDYLSAHGSSHYCIMDTLPNIAVVSASLLYWFLSTWKNKHVLTLRGFRLSIGPSIPALTTLIIIHTLPLIHSLYQLLYGIWQRVRIDCFTKDNLIDYGESNYYNVEFFLNAPIAFITMLLILRQRISLKKYDSKIATTPGLYTYHTIREEIETQIENAIQLGRNRKLTKDAKKAAIRESFSIISNEFFTMLAIEIVLFLAAFVVTRAVYRIIQGQWREFQEKKEIAPLLKQLQELNERIVALSIANATSHKEETTASTA